MKRLFTLATILLSALTTQVQAGPLVVYGEDDRVEVVEGSPLWQEKARSVAVQIRKKDMLSKILGHATLPARTLKEAYTSGSKEEGGEITLCEGTPFADQPNPGECTGFLVGPDLLLTAGHCVSSEESCADNDWIFDFQTDREGKVSLDVSNDRIYSCKKIIRVMLPSELGMDFSLIQLDRVAKDRTPLELNIADKVGKSDRMLLIGSPLGLPLKMAPNGLVRDDDQVTYFSTTVDSFLGNSGSPVFNQRTGKVEGILVAGEEDHVANMGKMCIEINRCKEDECRGEDASRITTVPELALRETMHLIAKEGKLAMLKEIESMGMGFFVDIYKNDRVSPLMIALEEKQVGVAELLLKMEADANHEDLIGRRPLEILVKNYSERAQFEELLSLLMNFSGDIHYKNNQGETLLFAAVRANNQAAIEILLSKGVDPKIKNNQNKSAKDIAKELRRMSLRRLLL